MLVGINGFVLNFINYIILLQIVLVNITYYILFNESVWIVKSNTSAEDIRNNLTTVINSNDSLFVGALTGEAAWRNVIDSNSAIKECF